MVQSRGLKSIFSHDLDRAVFVTYFLGAVIPLLALGWVTHRYALPLIRNDTRTTAELVALVAAVACLSLVSFFALRRLAGSALSRIQERNEHLARLLEVARGLSSASHAQDVAATATKAAVRLSGARAAYVVLKQEGEQKLSVYESSGDKAEDLYREHEAELQELVDQALEDGKHKLLSDGGAANQVDSSPTSDGATALCAAAAFPWSRAAGRGGALVIADSRHGAVLENSQIDVAATLSALTSVALENADLQEGQRNFFSHVTEILVAALDSHVDGRPGHATRVSRIANRLGRELEFSEERLHTLYFSALLHDVGMLKIERRHHRDPARVQKHAVLGHRMLSPIRVWKDAAPIVLHHHEWFDGNGYPEGLVGERIPLEARIIAVADAFDAMTQDPEHRLSGNVPGALRELRDQAGSQFDPRVVFSFASLVERNEIDTRV